MFTVPDLPYALDALEPYIDTKTMEIHHGKHHAKYVENLNAALEGHDDLLEMDVFDLIQNLAKVPDDIKEKVRNNAGGHANHSLFWNWMAAPNPPAGGGGENKPSGPLMEAIEKKYADFAGFQERFKEAALKIFGSGWAWLIIENGEITIATSPNQDSPLMLGKKQILGLDVWEHAYYLKYQNRRPDYIDAWWHVVNWDEANRRLTS